MQKNEITEKEIKVTPPKIQDDINKLSSWGKDWDMTYNVNKCKVVHLGNNNPKFSYKLNDILIQEVDQEKDLGVLIDYKFKFNEQCAVAAKGEINY